MRCFRITQIAVVFLIAFSIASPSQAQSAFAVLVGNEEAPSVSSTGFGLFFATVDDVAQTINFQLFYDNLEGDALFAHIHFGQRSVNGGVVAFLCGGGGQATCPAAGGVLITGVITPANIMAVGAQGIAAGEFQEVVNGIRSGVTYANVHTTKHGSGETRGQIRLVPPPTTPTP